MASEEAKRKAQLANLFPSASAPKQAKLEFKKISKEECELKTEIEVLEHKQAKASASHASGSSEALRLEIASEWGLTLPRPAPRKSSGGPKSRSEKWLQGLHD